MKLLTDDRTKFLERATSTVGRYSELYGSYDREYHISFARVERYLSRGDCQHCPADRTAVPPST